MASQRTPNPTRRAELSDVALNGSIYQQLRSYADTLDRALIDLRDPRETKADEARRQIADLLRKATVNQSVDHAAVMLRIVLGRRLQGLALCDKLATVLEGGPPNSSELDQLEHIALELDKECRTALARIRGKR